MSQELPVITGLGAISAGGRSLSTTWTSLQEGVSLARPISRLKQTDLTVTLGCELDDRLLSVDLTEKERRRMHRFSQYAVVAALDAVADAGDPRPDPSRGAVIAGTAFAGAPDGIETTAGPLSLPTGLPNASAAVVSIHLGWNGPNFSVTTACASSLHAIILGTQLIERGLADVVLAGGSDACIDRAVINGFDRIGVLSKSCAGNDAAPAPFDARRDGFVLGEGGAFCLIESADHAASRGVTGYAQVAGYALTSGPRSFLTGEVDVTSLMRCMQLAAANADLVSKDIGGVIASAGGLPSLDDAESAALEACAYFDVPITSLKGTVGHLMGASGAFSLIGACLALQNGSIPPTANFHQPAHGHGLNIVKRRSEEIEAVPLLVNAFSVSGQNASVVLTPAIPPSSSNTSATDDT